MRYPLVVAAAAVALLSGCAGTPRLSALHDPLYQAQPHTSTITARATEPRDGIAEIRIDAIVGELTACTGAPFALPSLIPCRRGAILRSAVCTFPNVKTEATCAMPMLLSQRRLVTYWATTRSGSNRSASTPDVTYAGGEPLTVALFNTGQATIPWQWETARPVIWRTGTGAAADRNERIDLGFVPHATMPSYSAFTDDLHSVSLQVFYTDTNPFSSWTRAYKSYFNLWAGPAGADGTGCTRTFAAPASTVRAAFDGTAILHRNEFRDCASLSLGGGAGTVQTTLTDAAYALVHESGHFLFGLGDEYVGGGNVAISTPKNVEPSKAACEATSTAFGVPAAQCVQIGNTGKWRNDDGQLTTMEDRNLASDWRTLSIKALATQISNCINGSCY